MAWQCPYCQHHSTLRDSDTSVNRTEIHRASKDEDGIFFWRYSVRCPNPKCRKVSFELALLFSKFLPNDENQSGDLIKRCTILPESSAKPQPEYIPKPIVDDYVEACRIRDLSSKASATLSRRCLQGMIRDFCGIARDRLIDEIRELRKQVEAGRAPKGVESDTIDAIDHVRTIGNIGAHMEVDINVIVDVDPGEAQTLIDLLELLFAEWYVARNSRTERLRALGAIAAEKKAAKSLLPAVADSSATTKPNESA